MKTPLKQLQQKTILMGQIRQMIDDRPDGDLYREILISRLNQVHFIDIPGLSEIERILTDDQILSLSTAPDNEIRIIWSIDDVHEVRPELTNAQCRKVLQAAKSNHDSEIGINWDVLKSHAEILFGDKPDDLADDSHRFELEDKVIMPEPDREQHDMHQASRMAKVVGTNMAYDGRGVNCADPVDKNIYSIDGRRLRIIPVEVDDPRDTAFDSAGEVMDISS